MTINTGKSQRAAIVLRGGTVIDGTGGSRYAADVRIEGDRIAAIGPSLPTAGATIIDAAGLVVAPGFIDVHTHDDQIVLAAPPMLPKISQGVTTVVVGNCGISLAPLVRSTVPPPLNLLGGSDKYIYPTMAAYAAAVADAQPAVNVAALVGHSTLRVATMRDPYKPATPGEQQAMVDVVARRHGGRRRRHEFRRVLRHRRRGRHRRTRDARRRCWRSGRCLHDPHPRRNGSHFRFAGRGVRHREARQAARRDLASQVRGSGQLGPHRADARAFRRRAEVTGDRPRLLSLHCRVDRAAQRSGRRHHRHHRHLVRAAPGNVGAAPGRHRRRMGMHAAGGVRTSASPAAPATSRCARTTCSGCCNIPRR